MALLVGPVLLNRSALHLEINPPAGDRESMVEGFVTAFRIDLILCMANREKDGFGLSKSTGENVGGRSSTFIELGGSELMAQKVELLKEERLPLQLDAAMCGSDPHYQPQ